MCRVRPQCAPTVAEHQAAPHTVNALALTVLLQAALLLPTLWNVLLILNLVPTRVRQTSKLQFRWAQRATRRLQATRSRYNLDTCHSTWYEFRMHFF